MQVLVFCWCLAVRCLVETCLGSKLLPYLPHYLFGLRPTVFLFRLGLILGTGAPVALEAARTRGGGIVRFHCGGFFLGVIACVIRFSRCLGVVGVLGLGHGYVFGFHYISFYWFLFRRICHATTAKLFMVWTKFFGWLFV